MHASTRAHRPPVSFGLGLRAVDLLGKDRRCHLMRAGGIPRTDRLDVSLGLATRITAKMDRRVSPGPELGCDCGVLNSAKGSRVRRAAVSKVAARAQRLWRWRRVARGRIETGLAPGIGMFSSLVIGGSGRRWRCLSGLVPPCAGNIWLRDFTNARALRAFDTYVAGGEIEIDHCWFFCLPWTVFLSAVEDGPFDFLLHVDSFLVRMYCGGCVRPFRAARPYATAAASASRNPCPAG